MDLPCFPLNSPKFGHRRIFQDENDSAFFENSGKETLGISQEIRNGKEAD